VITEAEAQVKNKRWKLKFLFEFYLRALSAKYKNTCRNIKKLSLLLIN